MFFGGFMMLLFWATLIALIALAARWVVSSGSGLRRWFGHDAARWDEFRVRYFEELRSRPEHVDKLRALARQGPLTLVFAAQDVQHNNAVVLKELFLEAAETASTAKHHGRTAAPSNL